MFEDLLPLYSYCENVVGPIAQPLNFMSSAVFWLAAVWVTTKSPEDEEPPTFHHIVAILMFIMGMTGIVWHTTGSQMALALDMIAVYMTLTVIVSVLCNDVLDWDLKKGLAAIVVLIFLSAALKDASGFLPNHGGAFLPFMFFLAMVALKIQTENEEATVYLLSAAYVFFLALAFRSADQFMCGYFPQGLHFMWHALLAVSIIYISKTLEAMKVTQKEREKRSAAQESQEISA